MRGFWRECRRVLGLPGLLLVPLCAGVLAGIDTHEGLPLDLLAVPITAAFVLVVVVLFTVLMCRIPRVRRRLDSRKAWADLSHDRAEALGARLATLPSDAFPADVIALLANDKKIQAIRRYRALTGVSLKQAKDTIESM
jgi:hypothetical protein